MSDNSDEVLKPKSDDQSASSAAPPLLRPAALQVPPKLPHVVSAFEASGFVAFIKVFAALAAALAFILAFVALTVGGSADTGTYWYLSLVGFGSAMSLFISAHVITTIEKMCVLFRESE